MLTSYFDRTRQRFTARCFAQALLIWAFMSGFTQGLYAETTNYSGASLIPGTVLGGSLTISGSSTQINITQPGTYYLAEDITDTVSSTSTPPSAAIIISASNVTVDLNGHTITSTGGLSNTRVCFQANDCANITIRNGTIVGFCRGVQLLSSSYGSSCLSYGHLIENLNFTKETFYGAEMRGIGCRAFHCRSVLIGGYTGNTVYASFYFVGLSNSMESCDVIKNGGGGSSTSIGVTVGGPGSITGTDNFIVNNRFSGLTLGIQVQSTATLVFRDNLASGVTTPYPGSGATNAMNAGNNY